MNFINLKADAVVHGRCKGDTKGLRVYKIRRLHGACVLTVLDSSYLQHNVVLLFAIHKSLYNSRT